MQKLSQICNKYLFWFVLFLSAFIPLYPKFPLFNIPGTYVAIRAEDFFIALVGLIFGVAILPNIKGFLKSAVVQSFLLFWAIGAISLFSAIFITQTVVPHIGFLHYLRRVEVMVLFFIAWYAFRSMKQVKIWLGVMLLASLIIILYGFGQQWLQFPVISTTNREFSKGLILYLTPDARINSTFAGHYDLATYLAMFLTMSTAMFLYFEHSEKFKLRLYFNNFLKRSAVVLVSALGFILLALTAARVSFAAAVAGIFSVFALSGHKKLILLLFAGVLFAFVISPELRHRTVATFTVNFLGGGGPKYEITPQQIYEATVSSKFSSELISSQSATLAGVPIDIAPGEPVNTTELGVYRSFNIRFNEEWPRAIRAFYKNPILGTGYSSVTIATDNDYLRSLAEVGILGTVSFTLIFFIIIKSIWKYLKIHRKNLGYFIMLGLISMIVGFLLNAIFIDVFESSKVSQLFWLSLGVGFAIIRMERN